MDAIHIGRVKRCLDGIHAGRKYCEDPTRRDLHDGLPLTERKLLSQWACYSPHEPSARPRSERLNAAVGGSANLLSDRRHSPQQRTAPVGIVTI
jgi:hypothetical protein